ncbi:MAG: amidohydrolase [Gammaproteobacteria bacterium]|nr:amidohydrolase [Gammaproteobacteria bacterium]OUU09070.1 MAG: hypothetical protein CBB94_08870 [Gammaproteobacteria bacterium TMED34]
MSHDLVIRGGTIVDGTGAAGYSGDVAIDGDTITALGEVSGKGIREIDADGLTVTPGFVDLHTHFDAQAGWEPKLTPVSWHGVTTALFGNCGVTFAPCKPKDREFLANMMETVEDIPRDAILNGLAWDWQSYGEYLDSIEKLNPAINIAGLVGHCASRFFVMGERAVDEDPNEEEIQQIAKLVGESVKQGAVGFSSNRLPGHVLPDGRSIPGTFAKSNELEAIAKQVGANGGILQFVLNYGNLAEEMDLITTQARAAGTQLLFSAPFNPGTDGHLTGYDEAIAKMKAEGLSVNGLTLPRSGGFIASLATEMLFNMPMESWRSMRGKSAEERLAMIKNDEFRQKLIEEAKNTPRLAEAARNYFYLGDGDRPNYTRDRDDNVASMAHAVGEHPAETILRMMIETDGKAQFHMRFFNNNLEQVKKFLQEDWILPGLGDAGAHVSQIMDSGWTSFLLSHWVRDEGEIALEECVRKMTSAQAKVIGLKDRGALAEGMRADVNVIDLDNVAERQPQLVHDFPNKAPRLIQEARGYRATICNGEIMLENNEHTGAQAGRVLRNGG